SPTARLAADVDSDLKNTTDDALPNYLSSLNFKQSHTHTDVRLALGYTAVAIAGILFYFDYRFGWEATKAYTAPAVLAYFLINSAFAYWTYFVEKGTVYVGESSDGRRLSIASHAAKHTPIYELAVRFTAENKSSQTNELWQEIKIQAPFTRWFTADGFFVAKPFQQWLASEIPAVGDADPANVVEEIGRGNTSASPKREIKMERLAGLVGATRASGA
ncbi:hypothetical protein K490DRAFT_19524, partial [Saccharata proteae CBS 121410]